ncbi:Zinc/iron permease [Hesseltinella vesiculosa]|uniref:Zinc/iron permease n=1 Tax=Hesseltinella vesiculosa TaxID=101127 RepID=A0A1X2GH77_9FUNG|nr:Zinc/iron permease [Hesseltinella vesiculosa]
MLIGSFLFGCIPLSTKLSEAKLRHFTALGVGLLIGTSLVVIIPEGIETLYSSSDQEQEAYHRYPADEIPNSWSPDKLPTQPFTIDASIDFPATHGHAGMPKHMVVGWALILGFVLMFIIDQFQTLSGRPPSSASSASASSHVNTVNAEVLDETSPDDDDHAMLLSNYPASGNNASNSTSSLQSPSQDKPSPPPLANNSSPSNHHHHHGKSLTPTIGLMVHAAADGIALGASANHPSLSMVVFLAIMLHKGPSAFALTTVLLTEGFPRALVRKHLLLFSMAAPTGALTTYLLLALTSPDDVPLEAWTGFLLIFSGGTFLFVAMHALQELMPHAHGGSHHPPSKRRTPAPTLERSHILCILAGMFLPVILNIGHSH